jgi:hypothetical protein
MTKAWPRSTPSQEKADFNDDFNDWLMILAKRLTE